MILHIMIIDKFVSQFIELVQQHFNVSNHKFVFITSEKYELGLKPEHNAEFLHTNSDFELLILYMQESEKIILHGLWRDKVDAILLSHKKLLKKCFWIMWGGDFYFPDTQSAQRKNVIKDMGTLVTGNSGDVEYVRTHYGAKGKHVNCISYLSNVFYDLPCDQNSDQYTNIQVGHSATKTNNHSKIFSKLCNLNLKNIKVHCPLSYGDSKYAVRTQKLGQKKFGENFIPLTQFLSFDEYQRFLSKIDYAIFDAQRQQGFSNLIYLLGMGKKVFINRYSNLNQYFSDIGIRVYDTQKIDLSPLPPQIRDKNMLVIRQTFTECGLINALNKWIN